MFELQLTASGKKVLRRADEQAVRIEQRIARALTRAEREALRLLLARCVEAIDGPK